MLRREKREWGGSALGHYRFKIVAGTDKDLRNAVQPTPDDVRQEVRRRLARANLIALRALSVASGYEMPKTALYLAMQIEFVGQSLAALNPIPADFADDLYWPS